jgi:hypothetical protein
VSFVEAIRRLTGFLQLESVDRPAATRHLTNLRNLLAPVYEWFSEGFNTQDLKDTKALLEALA